MPCPRPHLAFAPVLALALATAGPAAAAKGGGKRLPPSGAGSEDADSPSAGRPFMVGLEGVGLQVPALRPRIVELDPRFVGNAVAMGGVGVFGRYRPRSLVGFEVDARSGSLRYNSEDQSDVISHDLVLAEAAVMLYVARGKVGQLALDGGLGGVYNRVAFELGETPRSVQQYGSFVVRAGVDAEFLLKRVAVVLSLRTYGVVTPRGSARFNGPLFDGRESLARQPPVSRFATYIAASAGLAYRF